MRSNPTPAEARLRELLRKSESELPQFQFQHVIFPFIADFAFLSLLLIIEVDGDLHKKSVASDSIREHELERAGWKIIRFSNREVFDSPDEVLQRIKLVALERRKDGIPVRPEPKFKRAPKRKMVVPLPRVVFEEVPGRYVRTRASKVRVRKALAKGEKAEIFCAICKNPIAMRDTRIRFKSNSDDVSWVHKSCQS